MIEAKQRFLSNYQAAANVFFLSPIILTDYINNNKQTNKQRKWRFFEVVGSTWSWIGLR